MDATIPPTTDFVSEEPLQDDVPYEWKHFCEPKLRKYPKPVSSLRFRNFIGAGVEGMVFRARTEDNEEVAVKIYYFPEQPTTINGVERIWSFKQECHVCAILELVSIGIREAVVNSRPLFLNLKPRTRDDAIRNLRGFSKDYGEKYRSNPPASFEACPAPTIQINKCLGWTRLDGELVWELLRKRRLFPPRDLTERLPWYFAMVYAFVPEGPHRTEVILSQYDFYYLAGFVCAPFKKDNWRGSGILVDFSDLTLPFASRRQWSEMLYGRRDEKDGIISLREGRIEAGDSETKTEAGTQ